MKAIEDVYPYLKDDGEVQALIRKIKDYEWVGVVEASLNNRE